MADDTTHKQVFNIRKVATRSVTLYPARAQIVRDINNITLKPGANEITIYGLTPTADESSIKVDGKGSATITDLAVELVPNNENYEDIYPESESDSDDDTDDDPDDDDDQDEYDSENDEAYPETEHIRALAQIGRELNDALERANEDKRLSVARRGMLKQYADSLTKERPVDLTIFFETYTIERKKAYDLGFASDNTIKELQTEKVRNDKLLAKAKKGIRKARSQIDKQKEKEYTQVLERKEKEGQKRVRARKEKERANRRLKDKRVQFWSRKIYRVVVSLETHTYTPASSRRNSVDTVGEPLAEEEASSNSCEISLSVSYITSAACWAPRYDLSLNTTKNSGLIVYRAEYCNTTSETWSDAKIVLSTLQTAFQGLGDTIPTVAPWHIKLTKRILDGTDSTSGVVYSEYELSQKLRNADRRINGATESRSTLFGVGPISQYKDKVSNESQNEVFAQTQNVRQRIAAVEEARREAKRKYESAHRYDAVGCKSAEESDDDTGFFLCGVRGPTIPDLPALTTQESSWSESGLTATYDIPGLRTIVPSPNTRGQKIASVSLKDIHLSYLLVPKLRAAAFLKARLHNSSSITLLKGPCGLTLDGSFLGNTHLPRCSPGECFSLSLGVDPSVHVTYAKPVVKRSQIGVFQKEGSGVFTQTCTITNTISDRVLEGQVIDQIPVSEDERLRVELLQPMGLRSEGGATACGKGLSVADGKMARNWGYATAMMKKSGFVRWDVKLEPGRGVELVLEYEVRFPTAEVLVGVDDEPEEPEALGLFAD